MSLNRWRPYDPFYEIDRNMDRMFNRMRSIVEPSLMPYDQDLIGTSGTNTLAVDLSSDDKNVIVRAALPGFKEDEVDIDVQGNILTISAESKVEHEDQQENWHIREMRYGKFSRSMMLPEEVNIDKSDASLENGILTVTLPKQKPSVIKKIGVKARNLLKTGDGQD